ncbi:MAG: quinone-dependent dihydroorotate dehydrogenase [Cyanobacterium sp. T60_A2020_053]|nr:quinone-dependent dihydroorotate dehydrogenase [Cyanobacterium sp. T60_A2020_053]
MLDTLRPLYPLFFASLGKNPETAHVTSLKILGQIEQNRHQFWANTTISALQKTFQYHSDCLSQTLWSLQFEHPLGLAPGFDKNGMGAGIWASFGFSFAELGAVTLHAQDGNPQPRMFRLQADGALLNRMGANNEGAHSIAQRLQATWQRHPRNIPIGINLCKSKITPLGEADRDYVGSFNALRPHADYFVINVSSPNTAGLRDLQSTQQLKPILRALESENKGDKPILIKIAPDLTYDDIKAILDLAMAHNLAGIVATNTTISRENLTTKILPATGKAITEENGGISGLPLKQRSTEIIKFIYQQTNGKLPIIGVGGIFNAEDAWEKITAGASLLQFYSGWVYEGPWSVKDILQGVEAKVEGAGFTNIQQAIGTTDNG